MKFSMTGQEKGDLLIQVTAWILYVSFTILVDIVQITIFFRWNGMYPCVLFYNIFHSRNYSLVSSTNKTDHHDITEILLKVASNTIKQTNKHQEIIGYTIAQNRILYLLSINHPIIFVACS